jgi:pimeloyl-ACP methyl ester carboxylesterase
MPVLLLAGQQDSKFVTINAHMVKVARGRANLKLVVVPETGHAVHTERPLAVLQQLLEFCNTSACEP